MNPTLRYYEKNAQAFIQDTLDKDMSLQYERFEHYLRANAHILDAGCGSGRDSLYFKNKSYQVTAFDASEKMCHSASGLLGQEVATLCFEEMVFENSFDAIWASASLLHVSKEEMPGIMNRLALALKTGGILYASFKHGDKEFIKEERSFNSYTEESFARLIKSNQFQCKESFILEDTRPDKKGEWWLNLILTIDKS